MRYASLRSSIRRDIWDDEKFLGLSDFSKVVYLYLMTSPRVTACSGLLKISLLEITAGMGKGTSDIDAISKALKELSEDGLIFVDPEKPVLFVPESIFVSGKFTEKNIIGWYNGAKVVPDCQAKKKWVEYVRQEVSESLPDKLEKMDEVFGFDGSKSAISMDKGIKDKGVKGKDDKGIKGKGGGSEGSDGGGEKKTRSGDEELEMVRRVREEYNRWMERVYGRGYFGRARWDGEVDRKVLEMVREHGVEEVCRTVRVFIENFEESKGFMGLDGKPSMQLMYGCRRNLFGWKQGELLNDLAGTKLIS